MKKQLLLLAMILLPLVASADAVEIDGIYYNLIPKGKVAEVTSNPNYYTGEVVIPETVTYEDVIYSVTSIVESAFRGCSGLTSITIPNSVTSIGSGAFYQCSGLTSVTIPNSVTSIGGSAFYNCSRLTSLTIPNSVTSIGGSTFYNCSRLTSLTIPNSVTSIGGSAFHNCSGLTSLTIPNSVTSIGDYAFDGCSRLTSLTIPNSVTSIGFCAFYNCSRLTSLTIPNSVTSIGGSAFYNCSGLTSLTIPNSVTSIGKYAFSGCSGLTSLTIPNSVNSIGTNAFYGCSSLTSVTIGSGIYSIDSQTFASCPELTDVYCHAINVPNTSSDAFKDSYIEYATLHVPVQSIDAYKAKEPWKNFKAAVPLGNYFDLTINVGDKGKVEFNNQTITGNSNTFYIEEGANASLTITPDENYQIDMLTVNGVDAMAQLNNGVLTISNITANTTVAVTFEAIPMPQCSTPTIAMKDGKVHFECETEGVEYNYEILPNGALSGKGNDLDINPSYTVKVYASKDGYQDSDTATLDISISGLKGDVNNNGGIDIGDAVTIVNFLVGKTATLSRGTGVTEDMKEPQ